MANTLTFENNTDIELKAQVWHLGSRVFNETIPAGEEAVFTPGINTHNFNAVCKFDSDEGPAKLQIQSISLEHESRIVKSTGEAFAMKLT